MVYEDNYKKLMSLYQDAIENKKKICVVAGTGCGKTGTLMQIAHQEVQKGKKVIYVTHFVQLAEKFKKEYEELNPVCYHSKLSKKEKDEIKLMKSGIIFTSLEAIDVNLYQMLNYDREKKSFGDDVILVLDEIHLIKQSNFRPVYKKIKQLIDSVPVVIGMTATLYSDKSIWEELGLEVIDTGMKSKINVNTVYLCQPKAVCKGTTPFDAVVTLIDQLEMNYDKIAVYWNNKVAGAELANLYDFKCINADIKNPILDFEYNGERFYEKFLNDDLTEYDKFICTESVVAGANIKSVTGKMACICVIDDTNSLYDAIQFISRFRNADIDCYIVPVNKKSNEITVFSTEWKNQWKTNWEKVLESHIRKTKVAFLPAIQILFQKVFEHPKFDIFHYEYEPVGRIFLTTTYIWTKKFLDFAHKAIEHIKHFMSQNGGIPDGFEKKAVSALRKVYDDAHSRFICDTTRMSGFGLIYACVLREFFELAANDEHPFIYVRKSDDKYIVPRGLWEKLMNFLAPNSKALNKFFADVLTYRTRGAEVTVIFNQDINQQTELIDFGEIPKDMDPLTYMLEQMLKVTNYKEYCAVVLGKDADCLFHPDLKILYGYTQNLSYTVEEAEEDDFYSELLQAVEEQTEEVMSIVTDFENFVGNTVRYVPMNAYGTRPNWTKNTEDGRASWKEMSKEELLRLPSKYVAVNLASVPDNMYVIDVDTKNMDEKDKQQWIQIIEWLQNENIPVRIEQTKSGGYHIWLITDKELPVFSVKGLEVFRGGKKRLMNIYPVIYQRIGKVDSTTFLSLKFILNDWQNRHQPKKTVYVWKDTPVAQWIKNIVKQVGRSQEAVLHWIDENCTVVRKNGNRWDLLCPLCGDYHPSFSIYINKDSLVFCDWHTNERFSLRTK